MKKLFILLALAPLMNCLAQTSKPAFGPVQESERKVFLDRVIGYHDNNLYVLRKKDDKPTIFFLEKYDENLKMIASKELNESTKEDNTERNLVDIVMTKEGFIALFERHKNSGKNKIESFNGKTIDPKTIEGSAEYVFIDFDCKQLAKPSVALLLEDDYGGRTGYYSNIRISQNKEFVLTYVKESLSSKTETNEFLHVTLINKSGKIISASKIPVFKEKNNKSEHMKGLGGLVDLGSTNGVSIWDGCVTSEGKIYFILETSHGKKEDYSLARFEFDSGKLISNEIPKLTDKRLYLENEAKLEFLDENRVNFTGFTEKKLGKEDVIGGVYSYTFDLKEMKMTDSLVQQFDKTFMDKVIAKTDFSKSIFASLGMKVMKPLMSGSKILLVCETEIQDSYGSQSNGYHTKHYCNGFIPVIIDMEAKTANPYYISMRQYLKDESSGLGFAMFDMGSSYQFIYNDVPENLQPTPGKPLAECGNMYKAINMLCAIDKSTGKIDKKVLFENKPSEMSMCPRLYFKKSDSEFLLYGDDGRKFRFGTLAKP